MVVYASAELYEPQSGIFRVAGMMDTKRHKHDATMLADGCVLISGGADERDAAGVYHSAEIYDPGINTFVKTSPMHAARYKHTGTSLLWPSAVNGWSEYSGDF